MHVYNHIKKGHITHIHSCNHDGFQYKGSLVAQTDICLQKIILETYKPPYYVMVHIEMDGPPSPETLNLHESQMQYHIVDLFDLRADSSNQFCL